MAYIETPVARGSGALIEGGYVVTNAHVVWPYEKARVVFPDGTEFIDAPVLNWDLLGDVAVIGPLDIDLSPTALVGREDLAIGSDVFLIGYPGEAEEFPQPAISRGILSRLRQWDGAQMTYFQTDAAVAGGQSGGVLISEEGEVVGISGQFLSEALFGIVSSSADVLPRVDRLIAGDDTGVLGRRHLPSAAGRTEENATLENFWDQLTYVIREPVGTALNIAVDSESDVVFGLTDHSGADFTATDAGLMGRESVKVTTVMQPPYYLVIRQFSEGPAEVHISADKELVPFTDPDDARVVALGEDVHGITDHPSDIDYFVITLAEGDLIDVTVESILIDPVLAIDYYGSPEQVTDDDSGGGVFGLNAKITYQAPLDGDYFIVVADATTTGTGGYLLRVAEAPPGAVPVPLPLAPSTSSEVVDSPFGPMAVYESPFDPFRIQYPAEWTEQPLTDLQIQGGLQAAFVGGEGERLGITIEDIPALGLGDLTLSEYVDAVLSVIESSVAGFELVSREEISTSQNLSAEVLEMSFFWRIEERPPPHLRPRLKDGFQRDVSGWCGQVRRTQSAVRLLI